MPRTVAISIMLSVLLFSFGCGQKRALYLPDEPETSPTQTVDDQDRTDV